MATLAKTSNKNRLCVTFEMDRHNNHQNDNNNHNNNHLNHQTINDLDSNGFGLSNKPVPTSPCTSSIQNNHRYSLQSGLLNDNLTLDQGIYRRHSSQLESTTNNSLKNEQQQQQKSITRANSDIILDSYYYYNPHNNNNNSANNANGSNIQSQQQQQQRCMKQNGGNGTENSSSTTIKQNDFEAKRTKAALKKLANYINVVPRLKHKKHDFQRVTNIMNMKPCKCRICCKMIYLQCYECTQCKLIGHKKCLQNLLIKCPNKIMPPRLAVFGLDISDNNGISDVLSTCIMELEKRPIHKLRGIYKIAGNQEIIENICISFEFGSHLLELNQVNPYDIADVVKRYLMQLSTPIFNRTLQKELINIGREWPVRKVPYTPTGLAILVFELRRLVGYLPLSYKNNLAYLIYHLKRIVDRQNITEMSANSLAIVFAPIILRDETTTTTTTTITSPEILSLNQLTNTNSNMNPLNDCDDVDGNKNNSGTWNLIANNNNNNKIKINHSSIDNNNGKINHNHHNHNNHCMTTTHGSVQILLDVTMKIRVIELMICYANDIFADNLK